MLPAMRRTLLRLFPFKDPILQLRVGDGSIVNVNLAVLQRASIGEMFRLHKV